MEFKSGKVVTQGYMWHVNIEQQINESLKEGFENMLADDHPYIYFSVQDGAVHINVMLSYFCDDQDPIIFTEPLSEFMWRETEMYVHGYRTAEECLSDDGVEHLTPIRDALAKEVEILDKWIATAKGEE